MIAKILTRFFGTANERQMRRMQPLVEKINQFEHTVQALTDAQLAAKTNEFREQRAHGKTLDELLPEVYAVVREVSHRCLGQRHYDVQLMGGIVLHQGNIAEMKTGEGKTLTATLPLYLNALEGKGAHLVTVNDYLAKRDAEWMAPIYQFLGLEVSSLQHTMSDSERKKAYNADILYATNNELGFDYLRDNMKFRLQDYVQRDLHYAIVDEVDSILIDEARTPLIISGPTNQSSKLYLDADRIVRRLQKDVDYDVDEKDRIVQLNESGIDKVESAFNIDNLYAIEHINLVHHINQALRAHALFRRDVEYVVKEGQVLIVDEFTGRILSGRRYSDGLHQALEAKEGVTIEEESQTLATITLQNYFRLYAKLAGMTGTAATESEEFYNIYRLGVIVIPTNCPMIRADKSDLIFLHKEAKFKAIVEDVKERYQEGQPVLIGTVAIETSELLSQVLTAHGIPHDVLNAKNHLREAEIIAYAGEARHVTIATNMAGRGTDIKLTQQSRELGGLYILGTERHESRRIDNQLRGRSGRQGDPGESRFYIALDDDLMRRFAGGDTMQRYMQRFGMKEDEVIESSLVSKTIERAQEKVEKNNFEVRKHLLEYDDVLNQQRTVIYRYRREILEGEERISELIHSFIIKVTQAVITHNNPARSLTKSIVDTIFVQLYQLTGIEESVWHEAGINTKTIEAFEKDVVNFLLERYSLHRGGLNQEMIRQAEKWLMLEMIDQAWKQHMLNLDHLKEGIGLRGWGQKNPLIEYKREAFSMFKEMLESIWLDIVRHIFHMRLEQFNEQEVEQRRQRELEQLSLVSGGQIDQTSTAESGAPKVGRNEPCPCGSGKKFKKCCGR